MLVTYCTSCGCTGMLVYVMAKTFPVIINPGKTYPSLGESVKTGTTRCTNCQEAWDGMPNKTMIREVSE